MCHLVVFRKQEKVRERRKSLISRNRGFRAEFRKSVRYSVQYSGYLLCVVSVFVVCSKLKTRTMSALSVASTNWRQSRLNLATSTTNLNLRYRKVSTYLYMDHDCRLARTRHQSHSDPSAAVGVAGRRRHLSMQDRVELYNTALELDTEAEEAALARPRVRKSSKVMFEAPRPALEVTAEGVRVVERVEAEVQQEPPPASARTRKVSKVSMFEFVPEEN